MPMSHEPQCPEPKEQAADDPLERGGRQKPPQRRRSEDGGADCQGVTQRQR
jgi:hypothetical protein